MDQQAEQHDDLTFVVVATYTGMTPLEEQEIGRASCRERV